MSFTRDLCDHYAQGLDNMCGACCAAMLYHCVRNAPISRPPEASPGAVVARLGNRFNEKNGTNLLFLYDVLKEFGIQAILTNDGSLFLGSTSETLPGIVRMTETFHGRGHFVVVFGHAPRKGFAKVFDPWNPTRSELLASEIMESVSKGDGLIALG